MRIKIRSLSCFHWSDGKEGARRDSSANENLGPSVDPLIWLEIKAMDEISLAKSFNQW
jgi:hypothetical protein